MKNFFYKIFGKKTQEEKERERIEILKQLLVLYKQLSVKKPEDLAKNIVNSFYLDSVLVSKKDGSVLMSTEGDSFETAVKDSSLLEYVSSEFPKTKFLIIKEEDGYNIICLEGGLVYHIKAPGEVSSIEVRTIVNRLRDGLRW
jgi:hypothetical protein